MQPYLKSKLGDNADECALWAFGEGYQNILMPDFPERWNMLHSDLFMLHRDNEWTADCDRIIEAWESLPNEDIFDMSGIDE